MFRRLVSFVALALILAGVLATTARAGGRVDIATTSVPTKIVAGQPSELAFTIQWPNGEPVSNAKPIVYARCGKTRLEVPAVATKKAGAYVAQMTLPNQGQWTFEIDSKICGNVCKVSSTMTLAADTPAKNAKNAKTN